MSHQVTLQPVPGKTPEEVAREVEDTPARAGLICPAPFQYGIGKSMTPQAVVQMSELSNRRALRLIEGIHIHIEQDKSNVPEAPLPPPGPPMDEAAAKAFLKGLLGLSKTEGD